MILFIPLLIIIVVALFVLRDWLYRKPIRKKLLDIEVEVRKANAQFAEMTSFERYFACRDEQLYLERYRAIRTQINHIEQIGLSADYVEALKIFVNNFDGCADLRKRYNDEFVPLESGKYAEFFKNLEDYPLSADQIEAIVRDEDNNLVIAGAGTGKTTTISGKVAYVLEKGLAKPEELLVISFTKNAVAEMYGRCMRFCRHIPAAKELEVRTFNSYGFLVSRKCSAKEILLAFDGDDEATKSFLQERFDDLFLNDPNFHRKATNFLAFFHRPPRDEFEFATRNEYLAHEKSFKNVTLDGKKVNSKEEMEIELFLPLWCEL